MDRRHFLSRLALAPAVGSAFLVGKPPAAADVIARAPDRGWKFFGFWDGLGTGYELTSFSPDPVYFYRYDLGELVSIEELAMNQQIKRHLIAKDLRIWECTGKFLGGGRYKALGEEMRFRIWTSDKPRLFIHGRIPAC